MRKQLTARLSIFGGPLVLALIVMANCTQLMLAQRATGRDADTKAKFMFAKICVALVLMLIFSPVAHVFGQSAPASMTGLVTDQTGAVIPNATVTLVNIATNESRNAVSNQQGYYSLLLLPPGNYSLTAKAQGFARFVQENIRLDVGLALKVDASLSLGEASQSILVTDTPPAIETQTSSLGQVIDNQQVIDLPTNGRNSYSFAALVPGVLAPPGFTIPPSMSTPISPFPSTERGQTRISFSLMAE